MHSDGAVNAVPFEICNSINVPVFTYSCGKPISVSHKMNVGRINDRYFVSRGTKGDKGDKGYVAVNLYWSDWNAHG